jgi:hypothetical protein
MELKIELIPKSCWFVNSCYCLSFYDYDNLRRNTFEKVNYCCSICRLDTKESKTPLQIEEKWYYDDVNKIQKLVDVVALCENCFLATHIGLAKIKGKYKESINHFKNVTKLDNKKIKLHIEEAEKIYMERSKFIYDLDLSFLENKGYKLISVPSKKEREAIVLDNIEKLKI